MCQIDDAHDAHALRSLIFGLLRECPFGGNPEDCQFHELRKLSARDQWNWVQEQTPEELQAYYARHNDHAEVQRNLRAQNSGVDLVDLALGTRKIN